MTFVTVFAGGIAIQRTSWAIWFWQLGSCVLAIFFVYFMCLETGGKTLEEVDLVFMNKEDATEQTSSPATEYDMHLDESKDKSAAASECMAQV